MELDTRTFINSMDDIFRSKWEILNTALIRASALIAGGGVLSPYIRYAINDLDIYIHLSKANDFISVLKRNLDYILDTEGNYITPAYDQSFFRKNNIIARFRLYNPYFDYIPIDVMIIPDEIPILSVVTNFDLTCCEIWYDGTKVLAVDTEGILNRTCELKKDYVDGFLNSLNLFTIKRVQKYIKKGFTISYDALKIRNTFVKKSKDVTSPEEWVIYTLYNWILRRLDMPTRLSIVCNYPIHNYTLRNFESILPVLKTVIPRRYLREVTTDRTLYMKILFKIGYNNQLSYKYKTYIRDILGISNDDMIEYEESIGGDDDSSDGGDSGDGGGRGGGGLPINPVTGRRQRRGGYLPNFGTPAQDDGDFEETDDIDERNIQYQTCRDVVMQDDYSIEEYLREADTFLFIHKSSLDEILCYEKRTIEKQLNDKANWLYECKGNLFADGSRGMQFGDENDAYIRLPIYADGLNGFIHLSEVRKLLRSNNRIYYLYLDEDKNITHSMFWDNVFGYNRDFVAANHCQLGSKVLVFKLKICRDPERCLRSLPLIEPPPIQPPEDFDRVPSVRASPRRLTSEDFDRVSSVRSSPSRQASEDVYIFGEHASPPRQPSVRVSPPRRQPSEDFDRVPSVRASPSRRQPSEDFDRQPSVRASPSRRQPSEDFDRQPSVRASPPPRRL